MRFSRVRAQIGTKKLVTVFVKGSGKKLLFFSNHYHIITFTPKTMFFRVQNCNSGVCNVETFF